MRVKTILIGLCAVCLTAVMLSSCSDGSGSAGSGAADANTGASGSEKIKVVSTVFPQYDWVEQLVGDDKNSYEFTMLLDTGIDMHSYQPSVEDITIISTCDVFIYTGGVSDAWVEQVLASARNEEMIVINLFDVLGDSVKAEVIKEGMEEEDEDGLAPDAENALEAEEELDEHIWLSLKNATALCSYITDQLSVLKPESADQYQANLEAYSEKLSQLDSQYEKVVIDATFNTLVFADRFPFRYLVDDYGLDYYAAFPGCSAETEASFETVAFLAEKVDELGVGAVITIEGSNQTIAQTIISNTHNKSQKILTLDSMQSKTLADAESGVTYLSVMQSNLEILKEALN